MTSPPRCSLAALESTLLRYPLTVLNLTVRASNCLSHLTTISDLLECPESQLMRQRHFGRTSLTDVRRKLVHFCVDHVGLGPTHPIRVALYDPHPSLTAVWNTPPQARPLAQVVDDLLEVLSRPEELRAAGSWSYSTVAIGPPRALDLRRATLAEAIDSFFHPLRPRERRMLELRYGSLDGEGATLAQIGAEFGLTRERVRQIIQACLHRLGTEAEQQRRRPLADLVAALLQGAGGVAREHRLSVALRAHLRAPHPDCGAFLRVLLETEPRFRPVARGVWAGGDVSEKAVTSVWDAFHTALRAAGRPLERAALLSAGGASYSDTFLGACLESDERLGRPDGERYGLVEWQWLLPSTLDDFVYLALRSAGRPRHYLWITEAVNALVPEGGEVTPRDVHSILLDRPDRFARVREGTYSLAQPPAETAPHPVDGENGAGENFRGGTARPALMGAVPVAAGPRPVAVGSESPASNGAVG